MSRRKVISLLTVVSGSGSLSLMTPFFCFSLRIFVLSDRSFHVSSALHREVSEADACREVTASSSPSNAGYDARTDCTSYRNRKTGFDCPRGKGKGTVYRTPCNGKASVPFAAICSVHQYCSWCFPSEPKTFLVQIQKSHPVHIRNDDCANRKKVRNPVMRLYMGHNSQPLSQELPAG